MIELTDIPSAINMKLQICVELSNVTLEAKVQQPCHNAVLPSFFASIFD